MCSHGLFPDTRMSYLSIRENASSRLILLFCSLINKSSFKIAASALYTKQILFDHFKWKGDSVQCERGI